MYIEHYCTAVKQDELTADEFNLILYKLLQLYRSRVRIELNLIGKRNHSSTLMLAVSEERT